MHTLEYEYNTQHTKGKERRGLHNLYILLFTNQTSYAERHSG